MAFLDVNKERAEQNIKNGQGSDFSTPIEIGWYEVFVTGAGFDTTTNGKDFFEVVLTIRDDVEQGFQKRKIWEKFFLTEKAIPRLEAFLAKIGVEGALEKEEIAASVLGMPIQVEVGQREYNGKIYNNLTYMGFKHAEKGGRAKIEQQQQQESNDPFANDGNTVDINDDDLPF